MSIPNRIVRLLLLSFEVKNRWSVSYSRKLTENLCTKISEQVLAVIVYTAQTHTHI